MARAWYRIVLLAFLSAGAVARADDELVIFQNEAKSASARIEQMDVDDLSQYAAISQSGAHGVATIAQGLVDASATVIHPADFPLIAGGPQRTEYGNIAVIQQRGAGEAHIYQLDADSDVAVQLPSAFGTVGRMGFDGAGGILDGVTAAGYVPESGAGNSGNIALVVQGGDVPDREGTLLAPPAPAEPSGEFALVIQTGTAQQARIFQQGDMQLAAVFQDGSGNNAFIAQYGGSGNRAVVTQLASGAIATIYQTGSSNSAYVFQHAP